MPVGLVSLVPLDPLVPLVPLVCVRHVGYQLQCDDGCTACWRMIKLHLISSLLDCSGDKFSERPCDPTDSRSSLLSSSLELFDSKTL